MTKILASILAADILNLRADVQRVLDAGADQLHLDIMDGHFVPNLSFGPDIVRALRGAFPDTYMDVHLMITNPQEHISAFALAGASAITLHAEIGDTALGALQAIHRLGLHAGISLKPGTGVEEYEHLLLMSDIVLLMTVEPGFGGQKMIESVLDKAQILRARGFAGHISVDGGVNGHNARLATAKGADWLVLGTALFRAADPALVVDAIREGRDNA